MWSTHFYIPPYPLHHKEFIFSKERAVILRSRLYRKGSSKTKEIYVKNDVATWVVSVISKLYRDDRHHSSVSLSSFPYISTQDVIRKVFPRAAVRVCGDFTLKHRPAGTPVLRANDWMCNDFMVLIIGNVFWLGVFPYVCVCVYVCCIYAVCLV